MKKIISYLFVSFLVLNMAAQEFKIDKESFYFPIITLDCKEGLDPITNQYWSTILKQCNEKSLYMDSLNINTYRLMYWGASISVIELVKKENYLVCTIDSLKDWNKNKWKRTLDTLQINSNFAKLNTSINLLWNKTSSEKNSKVAEIDDSFNWVFEFKVGNKYKVINRHRPDAEIKNAINSLLDVCKVINQNIRP